MLQQIESLPALIRESFDALDERVRRTLNHHDLLSIKRIVSTGSGDSYMAALASELAFETLAELPNEPMSALQLARYGAAYQPKLFPRNPLVLGVSVSGASTFTVEALTVARTEGALTVALTTKPDSQLARAAEAVLDTSVEDMPAGPGVRTYAMSLLALLLFAIRIREVRDLISQEEANQLRRELSNSADAIEATIARVREPARELAQHLRDHSSMMFVGDGPNLGTALYSAAKVSEACGLNTSGHESEEWKHVQYYISAIAQIPTFFISPGGRAHGRVAELVAAARRIGRFVVAVTPDGDSTVAPGAHAVLPVSGAIREVFAPLVYAVPGAMFAAQLRAARGATPFNGFAGPYAVRT